MFTIKSSVLISKEFVVYCEIAAIMITFWCLSSSRNIKILKNWRQLCYRSWSWNWNLFVKCVWFLSIYNSPLISPAYGLGKKLSTSAATASMALIVKLAYRNFPRNDLKQSYCYKNLDHIPEFHITGKNISQVLLVNERRDVILG